MKLSDRADRMAEEVCRILKATPNEDDARRLRQAIEKSIIEVVLLEQERCAGVAAACASADKDMAHKLDAEIRQTREALVANLSAMR